LPAGGAAAARGAVLAGSATSAALAISRVGSSSLNCWAGGGLQTLIFLTTKSGLHFSHSKLQAWPMIMGEINDCKLFKLRTLYYSLGSQTSQASESPY
jgi:hypothetical protein